MTAQNLKMSVSGVKLLNAEDLLNYDKTKEAELAPPVDTSGMEVPRAPVSMAPAAPAAPPAPFKPPPDRSAELANAQDQAWKAHFLANVGRAGQSAITATSGVKDNGLYDSLDSQADQPVKDLKARMDVDKAQATENPLSQQNQLARSVFRKVYPTRASMLGPQLDQMTAAQLNDAGGKFGAQDKFDAEREDAANKNSQAERHLANEKESADAAWGKTLKANAGSAMSDQIQQRYIGNKLMAYNRATAKDQNLGSLMAEVDRLAPGLTRGKVPPNVEFGPAQAIAQKLPFGLGAQFSKKDDVVLGAMVNKLYNDIRYGTAGANLTENERSEYANIFQSAIGAPAEVKAAIIDSFRHKLYNTLRSNWAAAAVDLPPDMETKFYQLGGMGPAHPIFSDLYGNETSAMSSGGAAPSDDQPPPVKGGTETPINEPQVSPMPVQMGAPKPAGHPSAHPEAADALAWAKQHLNDPALAAKAKAIMQYLGAGQ